MSYRITEAERKHVATIEDLSLNLSVVAEEGTTPAVNLEITDNDKLNLSAKFPQYAIDIDRTDDEHSRFRIVDAETRETVLVCDGLMSLNGNPMGLGWRYGLEFILDDDGYVKGISLINKNNGNRNDKIITKLADIEIKSVVIPESDEVGLTVNAKALFTKSVSIETNSTDNALSVRNESGKHAVIGDVQFGNDYALKTEGDTKLSKVEVDDIELVGEDTEVSITADNTSFRNTNINLDGVEIEGNQDTRISHLARLSAQEIVADHTNVGTVNAGTVNASNGNINTISSNNVDTSVLDAATGDIENLTSENVTANNIATENATIHGRARFEGDTYSRALDVDGRLVAGEIKSLSKVEATDVNTTNVAAEKVVTNKLEAAVSEVITEKATSIETRNLNVTRQMDALRVTSRTDIDAARDLIAGNGVITDLVKSKDNKVLLEKANEDTITLGNINNLTVIKTKSDPAKSVLEEEFGHVKAVVDGREVYLANLEDVKSDRFDGYVNRSTNQDISGVKTFNDVIVASAGIGVKDEEGHLRGIISHVEDYTDIEFQQNPAYLAAQQEFEAYDELRANYDHLRMDYNNLMSLKEALENAQTALEEADNSLASEQEDDTNLRAERDSVLADIASWEESLATANANLTAKEGELSELQSIVNSQSAIYTRAQSDVDNELADPEIMSIALRETLYFGRDFDESFLQNNADYEYLTDEINCTHLPYAEALAAFDKMISILDILSGSTQENVVAYCNVTKEHILNTLKPTIENNHAAIVLIRDEALNALNEARSNVTAFESGELADAQRVVAANNSRLVALRAQLAQLETDIASNTYEIQRAENVAQLALEDKTEKEIDYTRNKEIYESNYRTYAERIGFSYTDEMIANGDFQAPEMSETVRRFLNDEIPQTNYGPSDTIHLGNSQDTLKVMSKGLHSGENIDEHIQATIDGHDHILANVDDMVAKNVMEAFDVRHYDEQTGTESVDKGKIVGDVTTKSVGDNGAALVIGQAPVITGYKGQVLPEDQERPSKVEKDIAITSSDNTVTISSDGENNIDFSVGPLAERLSHAAQNIKFGESSLIVTHDDGTEDELNFVSTNDDISFEALNDNILDINMKNFYNTEFVLKNQILSLYDTVQPRDLRKVPNAFDVKVLMDAVSARIDVLARNLEERLPVAPNEAGRYYLVANVRNNERGETTATYTWDGTGSLPEVHYYPVPSENPEPSDFDADGNFFVPYEEPEFAEYSLKMRIIKVTDDVGQIRYVPRVMWVRMDKESSDYSYSRMKIRSNSAVIGHEEDNTLITNIISKIDPNADVKVTFREYDLTERPGNEVLNTCFLQESEAIIGASLKDVVDFRLYNAKIILDTGDEDTNYAKFAGSSLGNGNKLLNQISFVEITSPEDAKDILIADNSLIGLVRKQSEEAYIGD